METNKSKGFSSLLPPGCMKEWQWGGGRKEEGSWVSWRKQRVRTGNRVEPERKGTEPLRFLAELRPQEPQISRVTPLDTSARPEDSGFCLGFHTEEGGQSAALARRCWDGALLA